MLCAQEQLQGNAEHVHLKRMYAWPMTGMSKWEYGARISTWQLASSQVSLAAPSASTVGSTLFGQMPDLHMDTDTAGTYVQSWSVAPAIGWRGDIC